MNKLQKAGWIELIVFPSGTWFTMTWWEDGEREQETERDRKTESGTHQHTQLLFIVFTLGPKQFLPVFVSLDGSIVFLGCLQLIWLQFSVWYQKMPVGQLVEKLTENHITKNVQFSSHQATMNYYMIECGGIREQIWKQPLKLASGNESMSRADVCGDSVCFKQISYFKTRKRCASSISFSFLFSAPSLAT